MTSFVSQTYFARTGKSVPSRMVQLNERLLNLDSRLIDLAVDVLAHVKHLPFDLRRLLSGAISMIPRL